MVIVETAAYHRKLHNGPPDIILYNAKIPLIKLHLIKTFKNWKAVIPK